MEKISPHRSSPRSGQTLQPTEVMAGFNSTAAEAGLDAFGEDGGPFSELIDRLAALEERLASAEQMIADLAGQIQAMR